jgi:hypothetical protein
MSSQRVYCTYFDSAYLARGIVMLRSLCAHDPSARIFVVAIDDLTARVLRARFGPRIRVIGTAPLLTAVPGLRDARADRTPWAYYSTQKPVVAQFAMESHLRPASVVYVDADTWFFSDPAPLFTEIGSASVAISPHRFSSGLQHLEAYGRYNAGFIYWRHDEAGRRCLSDWRDDCLEWCAEQPQPDGRFMNQGYLNHWPERYSAVHLIRHRGVNLAPWNVDAHRLDRDASGVTVDGAPLVFYHFHGLERHADGRWSSKFPHLETQLEIAREAIYLPYLAAVEAERLSLLGDFGVEGTGCVRPPWDVPPTLEFDPATAPPPSTSPETAVPSSYRSPAPRSSRRD